MTDRSTDQYQLKQPSLTFSGLHPSGPNDVAVAPKAKRDPSIHRRWILNAFEMGSPGHISPGSWKLPGDTSAKTNKIK